MDEGAYKGDDGHTSDSSSSGLKNPLNCLERKSQLVVAQLSLSESEMRLLPTKLYFRFVFSQGTSSSKWTGDQPEQFFCVTRLVQLSVWIAPWVQFDPGYGIGIVGTSHLMP